MALGKIPLPNHERFWPKIHKTDGCWIWQAQLNNKGYGCFTYYSQKRKRRSSSMYAHRLAWILTNGPIPKGQNVLHKCDTPACVNPDHLFLGTQRDNVRDCISKGRFNPYGGLRSNLTHDDVRAIRADPRKHHIIAADYGLLRNAVWNIKHRRSWKHVD
jgi:hypothetical protein